MPFYTQGPEQFSTTQNGGIEDLESTFGQSLGASFAEGAGATPIAQFGDMVRHMGEGGRGQQLSAEEANRQFGIPGTLKFDAPVSSTVAADLNGAKRRQILRQDAIDSGPQNIAASVARGGAGMLPQFLDPINLGASFVPGLGDARMAAALAEGAQVAERYGARLLADGLLGQAARTEATGAALDATRAGRLLQGASQGVMGQAALEPLNYAFDQDEHNDWSMGQALGNIAFGGLLGGGLHMLVPHARLEEETEATIHSLNRPPDEAQIATPMTARMESASPDTRGQVTGDAIAALNEDRPNNSESLLQLNEAQNLRDELSGWIQQNERVQAEQESLLSGAVRDDGRAQAQADTVSAKQDALRNQIAELREQHVTAAQEAQGLRDTLSRTYGDTTPDRFDAIHEELDHPALTTTRRQQLEHELQMLTEGGGVSSERMLEQARTQAQIRGVDKRTSALARQIERLERKQAGDALAPDATSTRAFRLAASRIQSRQDVLHALTHRSLARYARRVQSGMADAGLHDITARILSADNPDAEITAALRQITERRGSGGLYPDTVNQAYHDAQQRMAGAQTDAANDIARSLTRDDSPEIASARQASDQQTDNAPDVSGPLSDEVAQAEAALSAVEDQISALAETDGFKEELSDIAKERQRAEGTAKAYEAATGCMLRNM